MIPEDEYTTINSNDYKTVVYDIKICNNCGALAHTIAEVKHYKTCKAGEAKKWHKHNKNFNPDDWQSYEE
jgi:hypothetical protein